MRNVEIMRKEFRTKLGGNWLTEVNCKFQWEFLAPGEVYNLTLENITPTSVKIRWEPPTEVNGLMHNYEIEYKVYIHIYTHTYTCTRAVR